MSDQRLPEPTGAPLALLVSIINFRTGPMTIDCAQSVLDDMGDIEAHVVIVDNCSGDGSADEIASWITGLGPDARVSLICSPSNTGFSGGHNQGLCSADALAYLILNSDAILRPGTLRTVLAAMETRSDAGVFAPRLEDLDGTPQISCFRYHSPISELIRGAQTAPVTRILRRWDTPLPYPPDPAQIEWVSFACALFRREVLEAVGLLEEGYFLYFDDMDYCWRARQQGWDVVYVPEARVVHFRGGSGPVKTLAAKQARLPAYYYASRTRFLHRAYGRAGLLAANLLWTLGRGLAHVKHWLGGGLYTRRKEMADLWINFLDPQGDRRAPKA